ncbi:MAG: hypothetical protein WAZ94_07395 [Phycisphaerales bacterium]
MDIAGTIGHREVLTSSTLLARMVKKGLSPAQARQRMSRGAEDGKRIWRSQNLALPHNERLFARREFVGSPQFFNAVGAHLESARPGLARCLEAATKRPVLLEYEVAKLSASLLNAPATARVPTIQREMAALTEVGFRHDAPGTSLSRVVQETSTHAATIGPTHKAAAKRAAETQITRILGEHYRRHNLISWNSLNVADSQAGVLPFNDVPFCGYAYSWARPMVMFRTGRDPCPTPVMFDVYARHCFEEDVSGFKNRLERARRARKLAFPLLAVIGAYDFAPSAFEFAKKEGMLVVNLRDFFGNDALDALAAMEAVLVHVDAGTPISSGTGDKDLAEKLARLHSHPLIVDIKGVALESTAALTAKADGWEDVRLGVDVPFDQTTRDVDVLGMRYGETEFRAIECKAHRKDIEVPGSEVKKFFTETVPSLVKARSTRGTRPDIRAEFWTTGIIGSDAKRAFGECKMGKHIDARLWGLEDVLKAIPKNLKRSRALVQAISEV